MQKPVFSVVLIAKDEAKVLPRLLDSLKEFKERGGEVVVLDTGSKDDTLQIARDWGCVVGTANFTFLISRIEAEEINKRFLVDGEEAIVKEGDTYFNFAAARNHAASLASNVWVCYADADEVFTKLDIDAINAVIDGNLTLANLEYDFVFSHDQFGKPAIQFIQSKFYNKDKMKWTGLVHEVLAPITGGAREHLSYNIFLLEHWQQPGDRHSYLKGLAVDCFNSPGNDRNSHYFARELMWSSRPRSAIKEFERHIAMNGWAAERCESYLFMGDAFGQLNEPMRQLDAYTKGFATDSSRRSPLIKIARFYEANNNPQAAASYAAAAMQILWSPFYANNRAHYEHEPHEILYRAKGWLGDIASAQEHLNKALAYQPYNGQYLHDTKYYFEYYDQGIAGWMTFEELTWLYNTAKNMRNVGELGSWKGRSTHAIASGCKGQVFAFDTWTGSVDSRDDTNWLAKLENIFDVFKQNTKGLTNIVPVQGEGLKTVKTVDDKYFDMVFIDAGHTYEEVKNDIAAWLPKTRLLLCGHDYMPSWMGVIQAVDEAFGKPDGVAGTIWYKWVGPKVSIIIPTMGKRPDGLKRVLDSIEKLCYPKELLEVKVVYDAPRKGVAQRLKEGVAATTGEYIIYASDDITFEPDTVREALAALDDTGMDFVAFNTGEVSPDEGNICEHFMIKRSLLPAIGGEIFDTDFGHVGVDNLLWRKVTKLGVAVKANNVIMHHNHFTKGAPMDETYMTGWNADSVAKDRALLEKKLAEL